MRLVSNYLILILLAVSFHSCKDDVAKEAPNSSEASKAKIATPSFDANKAYEYIKTQVDLGPRVPGTEAQTKCAEWLQTELKKYADTVYVQQAELTQVTSNKTYPSINLIASFNKNAEYRVLLLSHWDSRPWADQDIKDKDKPIDAADDGASGVAVLLEIASKLKETKPNIGVDILLVDAEDVGKNEWTDDSYCLGTQHWAKNPHVAGYKAMFGICLDMVGAKGAQFPLEINSRIHAGTAQKEIWETANRIGYGSYFINAEGGQITDDHLVINTISKIPCVDVINLQDGGFGKHWHTHQDNMDIIDKATLKAVGQTVMEVIYSQE